MELIPYTSHEGREIVLRHHNALVVRDPLSQRLEIRGLGPMTHCPTCQQPLKRARGPAPAEARFDVPSATPHETYVDPNYFRMLQAGHDENKDDTRRPPSPILRLIRPTLPSGSVVAEAHAGELVSSASAPAPAPQPGARIRRDAFSPNYFKTFFVEEGELGRGGKGVVLLVRHQIDGCQLGHFACKRVPVGDDHAWLEKVLVEVELLAKLSHPNLVSYRHVWLEDVVLHRFGPSVACAFILQQYCNGGDLLRYIVGDGPEETTTEQLKARVRRRSRGQEAERDQDHYQRCLSFEQIYTLFRDIVSGLAYLHGSNYIHRDLKPSNCLLHEEGGKVTCLISDFGEVQAENAVRRSTGTTGTLSYCAPEVLRSDADGRFGNFTTKSDIFSLGMILYFLCFRRLPYKHANTINEELEDMEQLRAEISDWKGLGDERRERPDLPSKLYQLLKKMLALKPLDRPSATEVLTVMNHESNSGGLRRDQTGPTLGLAIPGRIIHQLKSFTGPLTSASEAKKRPVASPRRRRSGSPASSVTAGNSPRPAPVDVGGRQQGGGGGGEGEGEGEGKVLARSPSRDIVLSGADGGFIGPASDDGKADDATLAPPPAPPPAPLPLLMPPAPLTASAAVRYMTQISHKRLVSFYGHHTESVVFLTRLGLFLAKTASLARICWPYTVSPGIGGPLLGIAALDLGMPRRVVTATATADEARDTVSGSGLSRWTWDWRVCGLLLALHVTLLAAISRLGGLCAAAPDRWLDW